MPIEKRYKIIFSLAASLVFTLIVTKVFFFGGVPKINREKINRNIKNANDSLTIFKNTFAYKISPKKIDYEQVLSDVPVVEIIPTETPEPTPEPTLVLPSIVTPTLTPIPTITLTPTPTEIIVAILTPTIVPTVKKKPSPTPTPKPKADPLFVSNPLDQPYYNPSLAYKCYNADNLIKVYGGGGNPGSCYSNVKEYVDSNLTSVSIMGKSITIHKKAYPAFKAVSDKLKNYKGYKVKDIGTYVFRCNVNASTSDRFDLCSSGCVLSTHAFGISVDINSADNCNGCSNFTMPMEVVDAFESYGFRWGGRYKSVFGSTIDPMHFEYMYELCKDLN